MNRKHFTDCLQISLLILTEFERINFYPYEITIETFVFLMILEEIELHYIAQIHLKLEEKFGLSRFESVYIYIYIYIYSFSDFRLYCTKDYKRKQILQNLNLLL